MKVTDEIIAAITGANRIATAQDVVNSLEDRAFLAATEKALGIEVDTAEAADFEDAVVDLHDEANRLVFHDHNGAIIANTIRCSFVINDPDYAWTVSYDAKTRSSVSATSKHTGIQVDFPSFSLDDKDLTMLYRHLFLDAKPEPIASGDEVLERARRFTVTPA